MTVKDASRATYYAQSTTRAEGRRKYYYSSTCHHGIKKKSHPRPKQQQRRLSDDNRAMKGRGTVVVNHLSMQWQTHSGELKHVETSRSGSAVQRVTFQHRGQLWFFNFSIHRAMHGIIHLLPFALLQKLQHPVNLIINPATPGLLLSINRFRVKTHIGM